MAEDTPTDMPAPVAPAPGANVVSFPWEAAATAVAVLQDAAATLRAQLDARSLLLPSIVDWEGRFRDDFDATYERLTTTATGLAETLTSRASSIISAAESATAQQTANNAAAAEEAAEAAEQAAREAEAGLADPAGPAVAAPGAGPRPGRTVVR